MKVRELIEELQAMDPDREVIIQKDAEGNGYSPLSAVDDNCRYIAETTWYGEVKAERLTEDMIKQGYTDEDVTRRGVPACVLAPVN